MIIGCTVGTLQADKSAATWRAPFVVTLHTPTLAPR